MVVSPHEVHVLNLTGILGVRPHVAPDQKPFWRLASQRVRCSPCWEWTPALRRRLKSVAAHQILLDTDAFTDHNSCMDSLDGQLYTVHELANTITQHTLPSLLSGGTPQLVATLPTIPSGGNNSTLAVAEILLPPKNCMFPTQVSPSDDYGLTATY